MRFDRWIGRAPVQRPTALSKSRARSSWIGRAPVQRPTARSKGRTCAGM